jgi:hypothetical protein
MVKLSTVALSVALFSSGNVAAFQLSKPHVTVARRASSAVSGPLSVASKDIPLIPLLPEIPPPQDIAYGEESRKYRRTVYSHDDWVKFRDPNRFVRNLLYTRASGVYKNVGNEVSAVTAVAVAVVLYNCIATGYSDFEGIKQAALVPGLPTAVLPMEAFTLGSPSLGLLLGTFLAASTVWLGRDE